MIHLHEGMEKFNQNVFPVLELNFNTIWSMQFKQSWDFMEQAFSHQQSKKLFRSLTVAKRLISWEAKVLTKNIED